MIKDLQPDVVDNLRRVASVLSGRPVEGLVRVGTDSDTYFLNSGLHALSLKQVDEGWVAVDLERNDQGRTVGWASFDVDAHHRSAVCALLGLQRSEVDFVRMQYESDPDEMIFRRHYNTVAGPVFLHSRAEAGDWQCWLQVDVLDSLIGFRMIVDGQKGRLAEIRSLERALF